MDSAEVMKIDAFRERHWVKWAKMGVDILALQISLYLGYLFRYSLSPWLPLQINLPEYHELMFAMTLIPLGYWLMEIYPGYGLTPTERLQKRLKATTSFFVMLILLNYITAHSTSSRGIVLSTFAFAISIPPLLQVLFYVLMIRLNCWGTPVIVLGAAKTGRMLVSELRKNLTLGLRPVAILDDDPYKWEMNIEGIPVIGGTNKVKEFAGRVQYVMIAMPGAGKHRIAEFAKTLPFPHILIIPDLFEIQSLWVEARDLNGVLSLEFKKNLFHRRNWLIKRFIDYLLSLPLFILSLPLFAIISAGIKIASPGPVFYFQEREGLRGKNFKVWKFRTMHTDAEALLKRHLAENPAAAEEWQRFFKLKNDPRIIPVVGSILRKASLDELPQLWNVLCGEMSLVGPRPFPHYHLEKFKPEFLAMRNSVLPGMTGKWQVSARSEGDLYVQEKLDSYYIRNWSVWMDIYLLAKTVWIVVRGKGAY